MYVCILCHIYLSHIYLSYLSIISYYNNYVYHTYLFIISSHASSTNLKSLNVPSTLSIYLSFHSIDKFYSIFILLLIYIYIYTHIHIYIHIYIYIYRNQNQSSVYSSKSYHSTTYHRKIQTRKVKILSKLRFLYLIYIYNERVFNTFCYFFIFILMFVGYIVATRASIEQHPSFGKNKEQQL